jgi:cold shock protein
MREQGRVVSFNTAEGHGIIRSTPMGDELFVHFSFIEPTGGFRALAPGQVVEFRREVQPGPTGVRAVAQAVVVVPLSGTARYKDLLKSISAAVSQVDPMGLLAGGSPPDEYSAEVSQLAPRVSRAASREDTAAAVSEVFTEAFGPSSVPIAKLERLVDRLWSLVDRESSDAG